MQQGAVTAKGPVIRSALSALSHYLSQLNKVIVVTYYKHVLYYTVYWNCVSLSASFSTVIQSLSEYTWTSPSQQAKLHLVIEASHFVHSRMSDYVNLFEEDSQWLVCNLLVIHVDILCPGQESGQPSTVHLVCSRIIAISVHVICSSSIHCVVHLQEY